MNISYTIREWLQVAFTEQVDRINEIFYFDRAANEFYSVFITDYLLTDPNATEDYPSSPYSREELIILTERIDRQQSHDPSIIDLPRLTVAERKEIMKAFVENQHLQGQSIQNIIELEDGRTNLNFGNLLSLDLEEEWKRFKWHFVQKEIDTFCNLHNIDLELVSLWTDNKMTTMSFVVNDIKNELNPPAKQDVIITKPWWKFW